MIIVMLLKRMLIVLEGGDRVDVSPQEEMDKEEAGHNPPSPQMEPVPFMEVAEAAARAVISDMGDGLHNCLLWSQRGFLK